MKSGFGSLRAWACVVSLAAVGAIAIAAENAASLTEEDGKTASIVAGMVSSRHINHPAIDDNLSERLMKRYIETWDPQKMYFLQSDIEEFGRYRLQLDDLIKAGNIEFATIVFDRFKLRLHEQTPKNDLMVDADHDFTVQEEMIRDADEVAWAKDDAELQERWRKRVKYDLLVLKMDKTLKLTPQEQLHKRFHTNVVFMDQTEPHEVLELFLSSMTACLDPHSSYMSPQTLRDFQIRMSLQLQGIGARLKYDDGYTTVEEVLKDGPADKDGRLQKGDRIVGVSSDAEAEYVDTVEMKLTKVVDMIRGKRDTKVKLQVLKEDGRMEDYVLVRDTVPIEEDEVKGKIIESSEWIDGRKARIGVLNIPSFYRDFRSASLGDDFKSTSRDVRKVLAQFNQQQVDCLIVDLRWNGGGALQEAIEVSGLFIPNGSVVQVKEQDDTVTAFDDEDKEMVWRKPMVVVCNRYSASASEIFAGAIKDYRRGIVVGDRTTHGKGTVQNVVDVGSRFSFVERGALKLTISKFYRVNGESTQTKGVMSDVILPSLLNHRDIGEDALDNALPFDSIPRASYVPFSSFVNETILSQLKTDSESRVSKDGEFQRIDRLIAKYLERKNDKTVSLNESVLRAEEEELKQEQKEEEEAVTKGNGTGTDHDIFPDDFYNKELINISVDYLELLQGVRTARS
ncbi:MAG: carboxy terminal-processing peptidase [Planctomycetaceae bacterium]|nr:carboxy terminal-processing peptidase [Planctomycetaceae bacterium]